MGQILLRNGVVITTIHHISVPSCSHKGFLQGKTFRKALIENNNKKKTNQRYPEMKQLKCLYIYILMEYSDCDCPLISNVLR
jgi:hypothetical protein